MRERVRGGGAGRVRPRRSRGYPVRRTASSDHWPTSTRPRACRYPPYRSQPGHAERVYRDRARHHRRRQSAAAAARQQLENGAFSAALAAQVEELLHAYRHAQLLTSTPGIGVSNYARILFETDDASHLTKSAYLTAYDSVAPITRKSNTSFKGEHPAQETSANSNARASSSPPHLC
ncbi:transposase [Phytoactinopolyspora halophila]|uniref:transposase n=1 Tax=Phytoactinopolyspora halophila TaxID=1981511 RepID=UPI001314165F